MNQRMSDVFIVPGVPATRIVLPFGMPPPSARSSPSTYVSRRGTSTSIASVRLVSKDSTNAHTVFTFSPVSLAIQWEAAVEDERLETRYREGRTQGTRAGACRHAGPDRSGGGGGGRGGGGRAPTIHQRPPRRSHLR